jgi:guanylate kinase
LLASDATLQLSRSWTTRLPRSTETEADYNFVTREEFVTEVERGGFLEWAEYIGHLYGTPVPTAPPGVDMLLVIEVQGAEQVLKKVKDAVMILIVPPTRDAQALRLRSRGDSDEHVAKRLAVAPAEEAKGREMAHYVVVNDDVDSAVAEVAGILARYRKSPP